MKWRGSSRRRDRPLVRAQTLSDVSVSPHPRGAARDIRRQRHSAGTFGRHLDRFLALELERATRPPPPRRSRERRPEIDPCRRRARVSRCGRTPCHSRALLCKVAPIPRHLGGLRAAQGSPGVVENETSPGRSRPGKLQHFHVKDRLSLDFEKPSTITRPSGPERDTFSWKVEIEVGDAHRARLSRRIRPHNFCGVGRRLARSDLVDNVHAFHHSANDRVFAVSSGCGTNMMKNWLLALSGLSARAAPTVPRRNGTDVNSAFTLREGWIRPRLFPGIAALSHEVGDHAVESQPVVKALARQSARCVRRISERGRGEADLDRAAARKVKEPVIRGVSQRLQPAREGSAPEQQQAALRQRVARQGAPRRATYRTYLSPEFRSWTFWIKRLVRL